MNKIYCYLRSYWKEEVKLNYFLVITGFLTLCVFLEYNYHLFSGLMNPYKATFTYFFAKILFFSLPVFLSVFSYIHFYKRKDLLGNTSFWIVLLYIICAYSFKSFFYYHKNWILEINNGVSDYFLLACTTQFTQAILLITSVFIFWIFSGHSKETTLYGFKLKGFDTKPYFLLLLIVLPIIIFASTQSDFLHRYPMFSTFVRAEAFSPTLVAKTALYEILYGSDYMAIELFFRGFMIYVLARFIGKGAIIPMATMYVFIHFGKPVGETISSFFGGLILGVIAYETKSILGGIIVHCGIAYMMEIGGFIGNLSQNN